MKRLRIFLACLGRNAFNFPGATPPLGILSLAAYIREHFSVDLRLVDQRAENCSIDQLAQKIIGFEPDIVGIGLLTSYMYMLPELTEAVRTGLPRSLMVLGGPHVSSFEGAALENNSADAAVMGEGELPFAAIVQAHLAGSNFSEIPGVAWRDASGEIVVNPGALPLIEDLDSLPFPAYDLLDVSKYWETFSFGNLPPHRYVAQFTSRGCPRECSFCHRIFGKRFRGNSPERVVAEMKHFVKTFELTEIEILDDTFNHDARRVIEISRLMQKENLKIKLGTPNGLQSHTLTEDVLDALVDAGLHQTALALESGSPRIQKVIGKHLSIPKFLWCVDMTTKRRILTTGYTILGFPTETEEDIQATIDVACGSRLHTVSFFTIMPYPNTPLYNQILTTHPARLKNIRYDNKDFSMVTLNFSEVPDDVLFARQRKAWRRFYLNPRRMARIIRDYPDPWYLPRLLPMFAYRITKGLLDRS